MHPLSLATTSNGQTCEFVVYESKLGKRFFNLFIIILFFHPIAVNTNHILGMKKHSLHVEVDLLTYKEERSSEIVSTTPQSM